MRRPIRVLALALLTLAPFLALAQTAPQGKARLAFYLVDEAASDKLEKYYERRPNFRPRRNADGSYAISDAIVGTGRVVMELAESAKAGRSELPRFLVLVEGPALSGLAVTKASVGKDPFIGTPTIKMTIGDYDDENGVLRHGAEIFAKVTGDNVGESIAVVFDNRIITYARIAESISGGEVQISGGGDDKDVADIVAVLNGGK